MKNADVHIRTSPGDSTSSNGVHLAGDVFQANECLSNTNSKVLSNKRTDSTSVKQQPIDTSTKALELSLEKWSFDLKSMILVCQDFKFKLPR